MTTTETNTLPAHASGTFEIAGKTVHRLGYGSMRLTGKGIWGEPADRAEAIRVVQRAVELGVDFIDTADSYGPHVSEEIIREALHPYPEQVVVATKAGLLRLGPDEWRPLGHPDYLRQQAELSLRRLGLERIDLFQLHRIDPKFPMEDQIGELKNLQDEGKIGAIGLSQVSVDELSAAGKITEIATVQNMYNLTTRDDEDVLDYATATASASSPGSRSPTEIWPAPVAPSTDRQRPRRDAVPDRTGVAAGPLAGRAADPGNVNRRATSRRTSLPPRFGCPRPRSQS